MAADLQSRWIPFALVVFVMGIVAFITPLGWAQANVEILHSFGANNAVGTFPGPLVRALDGQFYGFTTTGVQGSNGIGGTIYRLDTNGANPTAVFKFGDLVGALAGGTSRFVVGTDGAFYAGFSTIANPVGGGLVRINADGNGYRLLLTPDDTKTRFWEQMLEASDTRFYALAGSEIMRANHDGTGFESIYTDPLGFTASSDGEVSDKLLEGRDGMLYVSHFGGGTGGRGFIYRINKDGSGQTLLLDFGTMSLDSGSVPHQLIQGSDGALYGVAYVTTQDGSLPTVGPPIFRLNTDGSGYTVIARRQTFLVQGPNGPGLEGVVASAFFEGKDGFLYGATKNGGDNRAGVVFRVAKDGGGFTNLMSFPPSYFLFDSELGVNRSPGKLLVEGLDGRIHGTMRGNAVFRFKLDGSGFETTYQFPNANPTDEGKNVLSTLALDTSGTLYGTTRNGGLGDHGTVFKLNTDGSGFTYLRNFTNIQDGAEPIGGVIVSGHKLYGTCYSGGGGAVGTVFRIDEDGGNYQVLRTFVSTGGDGRFPAAPLIEASDGVLYGTTYFGGGAAVGTVFKLNKDSSGYAIIHRFTNSVSGANPSARLLEGADGRLYGSAETNGPGGQGALFALAKDGAGFTLLHNFDSTGTDLRKPQGALIQGSDGALYGTAVDGGAAGFGGVFRLDTTGTGFQVLREFSATAADGRTPIAGVTFGADGMLYGVTEFGGGSINGSIFRLNTDGTGYEKLSAFTGTGGGGGNPIGALVRGPDGTLYGTTSAGGDLNFGTVFRVSYALTVPPRIDSLALDRNSFSFRVTGPANRTHTLEWSANLTAWTSLFSTNNPAGSFIYAEPFSPNLSQRFYRVVDQP